MSVPEQGGEQDWTFGQITCKAPKAEGAAKFWEPGAGRLGERSALSDNPRLGKIPFYADLERRVWAAAARGHTRLGQVPAPLWASAAGNSLRRSKRGPASGPQTVNPGTSRLPLRPHLTTLGSRRFLGCSSAPQRLKQQLRPGRGRGPTKGLGRRPRPSNSRPFGGPPPLRAGRLRTDCATQGPPPC